MKKVVFLTAILFCLAAVCNVNAQPRFPRTSQKAGVTQTIGITDVSITYHRPGVKGRQIFGCETTDVLPVGGKTYPCLVPNNQVWRMGANEATVFEISEDVMINGQKLPKGKYSLHSIPGADTWTIIFNKNWGQWGSFTYEAKDDALRVMVKPETSNPQEWLVYDLSEITENKATVSMKYDKMKVSFNIDTGDVNKTTVTQAQTSFLQLSQQTANFILSNKMKDSYADALKMLDSAISVRATFGNLSTKARLLAEMGNTKEAITVGDKAIEVGKAAKANTAAFEKTVGDWKAKTN